MDEKDIDNIPEEDLIIDDLNIISKEVKEKEHPEK